MAKPWIFDELPKKEDTQYYDLGDLTEADEVDFYKEGFSVLLANAQSFPQLAALSPNTYTWIINTSVARYTDAVQVGFAADGEGVVAVRQGSTQTGWEPWVRIDNIELQKQINVLSNDKVDKNKNNICDKGILVNSWGSFMGDAAGRSNLLCNLYDDKNGNYRFINSHVSGTGAGVRISLFTDYIEYFKATNVAVANEVANITTSKIATTTKTDILCTEATGYTMLSQSNKKINNIMYYSLRLQKSDGSNFTQGTQITIGTMPIGAIPSGTTQYGYGSIFSDGSVTGAYCSVAFHPNGNIYVNPNGVGKYIVISGVVVL